MWQVGEEVVYVGHGDSAKKKGALVIGRKYTIGFKFKRLGFCRECQEPTVGFRVVEYPYPRLSIGHCGRDFRKPLDLEELFKVDTEVIVLDKEPAHV